MKSRAVLVLPLLLAACGDSPPQVTEDVATEARTFIEEEFGYEAPLKFTSEWHLGGNPELGMLCGEFEAPPAMDRPQLRYYYDYGKGVGQVELHEFLVTASPISQAMINSNRTLFDEM